MTANNNKPKRHSRDVFHAWMLKDAAYAGELDMPVLKATHTVPERLISFSDAIRPSCQNFDQTVHFFEDDCQIERFWNNPKRYVNKLSKFDSIIGLDYSVCWDFPKALKDYNYYRNNVCTYWMQQVFKNVIPQARCEDFNYKEVLAGHPKHSTIAVGARAMVRKKGDREVLKKSVAHIIDELEPSNLIWYGSDQYGVTEYVKSKNVPIKIFEGKGRGKLKSRKYSGGDYGRS